ncbi:MAG: methylated-DNA--[protein]-cysteine S-methyltransferase [Bermanella sp.]
MNPFDVCHHCIELLVSDPLLGNDLTALASRYELSPSHFQKMFKRYVGVSPKQFQQSILTQRAQPMLLTQSTLNTSESLQLSSPSRLHDAFVKIEAMSPGEFKSQGQSLVLRYARQQSVFGPLLVVLSPRGIFYLGFHQQADEIISNIQQRFPKAELIACSDNQLLDHDPFLNPAAITLHVPATNFQVQVWRALLATSAGQLISYKDIAVSIGNPKGSRGVGQAVGANPVAFLIPCHRVIKQSGAISGYRWGVPTKQALLGWEQALIQ